MWDAERVERIVERRRRRRGGRERGPVEGEGELLLVVGLVRSVLRSAWVARPLRRGSAVVRAERTMGIGMERRIIVCSAYLYSTLMDALV